MHSLAGAWDTPRIAVWELRDDTPVLLAVGTMVQSEIHQARQAWAEKGAALRLGRHLRCGSATLIPLRDDEQRLLGFVHVLDTDGPRSPRQALLGEQVLFQLAAALAAPRPGPAGAPDAHDSAWHTRRAELVFELDRLGWNYTKLAERKGVTRQTIHNRVRELGIVRPPGVRRPRET